MICVHKDNDEIFLFTLIDFLLQICFFGLLVACAHAVATRHNAKTAARDQQDLELLRKATGVSNIAEITDLLTRLGPISELKGFSDFLSRYNESQKIANTREAIQQAGGPSQLRTQLETLRKIQEGSGKPPCLFRDDNGKRIPTSLATVLATDNAIEFTALTPDLQDVLTILSRDFQSVHRLSLTEFRTAFQPIRQKKPDCMYTLTFVEQTRFVDARDAANSAFYLKVDKRPYAQQ